MFERFLSILSVAVLYSISANAAQLWATVEPQQVQFGDTVKLEISDDGTSSAQPDFSALQADFRIYSTSSSMQSSFTNGVSQQKRTWSLLLMPKREGNLQIPAIQVGNDTTSPLEVTVYTAGQMPSVQTQNKTVQSATGNTLNQPAENSSQNSNFWAELSVSNKKPYIQQAMNVTLYVYDKKGIDFQQEPVFDDTDNRIIRQTGNPVVSTAQGQRVIAFNYVMIPQKSGKIAIPRVQINGTYTDSGRTPVTNSIDSLFKIFEVNFDLNNLFATQKPVHLETQPIEVDVQPIPEDYGSSWWLPATALRLEAKWVDEHPVFKVGEAVTREISLIAAGVEENQMPKIKFNNNSVWKQYPEKPQFSAGMHNNELITQAVTRVVYIPQVGGEQEIPEIKLKWYNVKTNHIEKAVIPAEKIFVSGGADSIVQSPEVSAQPQTKQPIQNQAQKPSSTIDKTARVFNRIMSWVWLIMAFFAGIFVCLILMTRKNQSAPKPKESDCIKQIESNLKNKDYRGLRDALLQWSEQIFPNENIKNLDDLALFVNSDEFAEQMRLLNDNLYAGGQAELDAETICGCLRKKHVKVKKKVKQPLPDLYK